MIKNAPRYPYTRCQESVRTESIVAGHPITGQSTKPGINDRALRVASAFLTHGELKYPSYPKATGF
jgi:hypothetical protein